MAGQERFTCEQIINAIKGTGGVKTVIVGRLGCGRSTLDRYIARHPTVRAAYDAERQSIVDLAEIEFVKKVKAGFWPAIRLAMMTLGKDRGYTERHEVTGAGGGPIATKAYMTVSPDDWPDKPGKDEPETD